MSRAVRGMMLAITMAAAIPAGAGAAEVTRRYTGSFPIAASVRAPAGSDIVWVSGALASPPDPAHPDQLGNTEQQTLSVLTKLADSLKAEGLGLGDVTMMRVYMVGDPALGGKMDFKGMMASYSKFFGTAAQPNKPARVAMQVAALVTPGALVEIEVQAARPPSR
ncbi:RidA family protein [Sphingomonas morindae]|uniref:RidA family protein n=1 Tax=Sphingomonas morindae TaxID=1541170 RepID=A0ABY4XA64_9SPHN|nr:RidA family protein [Sphingomonas morindae]USI73861.1 RidA family protein [Sphingomonas morindae]